MLADQRAIALAGRATKMSESWEHKTRLLAPLKVDLDKTRRATTLADGINEGE